MRSRALTFAWEFWWRVPLNVLPLAAGVFGFMLLLYSVLAWHHVPFAEEAGTHLHFSFYLMCLIACATLPLQTQTTLVHQYTLPIATWKLVGWKMLHGVFAAVLTYAAIALTLNVLFEAGWPLLGQVFFAAVCVMWGQALAWSLHRSQLVTVIAGVVATILLGVWIISRYQVSLMRESELVTWNVVTTGEWFTLGAMAITAYFYGIIGVSRDRYGGAPNLRTVGEAIEQFFTRLFGREQRFASRQHALFWFEWRQKGLLIPLCLTLAIIAVVVWCWMPWIDMKTATKICSAMSGLGVVFCVVVGMLAGHNNDDLILGSFYTTRPATNTEMANSVLKTVGWSIVLAWLVWSFGLAIVAGRFVMAGFGTQLVGLIERDFLDGANIWWTFVYFVAGLLIACSTAGIGASLCLSRMWCLLTVCYVFFGSLITGFVVVSQFVPEPWHEVILNHVLGVLGVGFGIGTLVAFVVAIRWHLVRWQACAAGVVASVMLLICFYLLFGSADYATGRLLFAIGVSCLAAAPLATAPLAISWNRHR